MQLLWLGALQWQASIRDSFQIKALKTLETTLPPRSRPSLRREETFLRSEPIMQSLPLAFLTRLLSKAMEMAVTEGLSLPMQPWEGAPVDIIKDANWWVQTLMLGLSQINLQLKWELMKLLKMLVVLHRWCFRDSQVRVGWAPSLMITKIDTENTLMMVTITLLSLSSRITLSSSQTSDWLGWITILHHWRMYNIVGRK